MSPYSLPIYWDKLRGNFGVLIKVYTNFSGNNSRVTGFAYFMEYSGYFVEHVSNLFMQSLIANRILCGPEIK